MALAIVELSKHLAPTSDSEKQVLESAKVTTQEELESAIIRFAPKRKSPQKSTDTPWVWLLTTSPTPASS
eukprot:2645416-Amphidinium_carterae.1